MLPDPEMRAGVFLSAEELLKRMIERRRPMGSKEDWRRYVQWSGDYSEIFECPPADVREVVKGKWVKRFDFETGKENLCVCSNCKRYWISIDEQYDFSYCPNCGADMRGVGE